MARPKKEEAASVVDNEKKAADNDGMKKLKMRVKITFRDPILGTWPANEEIARDYISSKLPDNENVDDEIEAIADNEEQRGMTIFPKNEDGIPFFYDYQIKGFFKDACSMMSRVKKSKSSGIKAYKKIIDGLIFTKPRQILISSSGEISSCQRPLRANTPQGERVALANSEEIPERSTIEFDVICLDPTHRDLVIEWLEYGEHRGIGQWRNSGKGRFQFEILSETLVPFKD